MGFWRDERGQELIEYALLVAAVAVAGSLALVPVTPQISTILSRAVSVLQRN